MGIDTVEYSSEQNEQASFHGIPEKSSTLQRNAQIAQAVTSYPIALSGMMKIRETAMLLYGSCAFFFIILAFYLVRRSGVQKNRKKGKKKKNRGEHDDSNFGGAFPPIRHAPSVRSDMILYDEDEDLASVRLDESSLSSSMNNGQAEMTPRITPSTQKNTASTIALGEEKSKRLKLPSMLPTWEESLRQKESSSSSSNSPPNSHHSRHRAGRNNDPASSGTVGGMFLKMMKGETSSKKIKRSFGSSRSRSAFSTTSSAVDPTTRPRYRRKSKESDQWFDDFPKHGIDTSSDDGSNPVPPASDTASDTVMVVPFPGVTIPPEINQEMYS